LEIVVRGTIVYLALFFLLRFILRREPGKVGIADMLLVVLIADAAQNAMATDSRSITEGLVLVATLIFWNYALDWLAYRFSWVRRLIEPAPLLLVKDGRLLHRNLRQEMITEEELRGQLRQHGIEDVGEVAEARIESDGHISVLTRDKQ
jgi:uncharacterized membrane protein YcaP (DUF421 family)